MALDGAACRCTLGCTAHLRRCGREVPHRQHALTAICGDAGADGDFEVAGAELQHPERGRIIGCVDVDVDEGARAEHQRFPCAQLDDLVEDGGGRDPDPDPDLVAVVCGFAECGEVLLETSQPVGRCEAVDDGDGAEVEKLGRDGRLLSGDEDTCAKVALETDGREQCVG